MSKKTITTYSFNDLQVQDYKRDEVTPYQQAKYLSMLDLGSDPDIKVTVNEVDELPNPAPNPQKTRKATT